MRNLFFIISLVTFSSLSLPQNVKYQLSLDTNFPLWLKTVDAHSEQTSGITFVKNECGIDYFLLADDIGAIHLMSVKENKIVGMDEIEFVNETERFFPTFPKMDFEEITFDKNTGDVYLSVEGNGKYYNDYVGIFKLIFKNRDILSKKVVAIIRINYRPENLFFKYTGWNIGYEGFAVSNNYYFLGLEGFLNNNLFADSTLIFISNKVDMEIFKIISTKTFGIHTICGLYAENDHSIWGVDRNNRKIFNLKLDENFDIIKCSIYEGSVQIPGYKDLNYQPSLESITMDNEKNIYVVDDPWKEVFIPQEITFNKLDEETKSNFKDYIPTIYKYKITPKGDD